MAKPRGLKGRPALLVYQEIGTAVDEMNELVDAWSDVSQIYAEVTPLSGMEAMNARQKKDTTSHAVKVRNEFAILPTGRFLFDADRTRCLGIDSIFRPEEREAFYSIHCSEQVLPAPG